MPDIEAPRYPAIRDITEALGGRTEVTMVPIPTDCADGFNEAYYASPVLLLDPAALQSCSAWSFVEPEPAQQCTERLGQDLASGSWDERHGHLRQQPYLNGSLVLIRAA